jgi:hypothetical protein
MAERLSDRDTIKSALLDRIDQLARDLLGDPTQASRRELRYGNHGSMVVTITGDKAGLWHNHESGEGGDVFDLIGYSQNLSTKNSFPKILEWSRSWLRWSDKPPADYVPRPRQDNSAKQAAEIESRVAKGLDIWKGRQPLKGTLGEQYLKETRGILNLSDNSDIHYHPGVWHNKSRKKLPVVLIPATNTDGVIRAVQAVMFDPDTLQKVKPPQAYGDVAGRSELSDNATVRLRDDINGPVIIAEGLETALSIPGTAQGSIWMTMGLSNYLNQTPPQGRDVVLVSDGQTPGTQAWDTLERTAEQLTEAGHLVRIAKPPEDNDLNDVLRDQGYDAVGQIIDNAEEWQPALAPGQLTEPDRIQAVKDATALLNSTVRDWIGEAVNWFSGEVPPQTGAAGAAGLGKTYQAVMALADTPEVRDKHVDIYAPTVDLGRHWAARLKDAAPDLNIIQILGRGHIPDPVSGEAMCLKPDVAEKVSEQGLSVQETLCKSREPGLNGEYQTCSHYGTCKYQKQFHDTGAAVRVMAHAYLPINRPEGQPKADMAIVDESFYKDAIAEKRLPLDAIIKPRKATLQIGHIFDPDKPTLTAARMSSLSETVHSALLNDRPLAAAIIEAGFTSEEVKQAAVTELMDMNDSPIDPSMPDDEQLRRLSIYRRNDTLSLNRMWRLIHDEMTAEHNPPAKGVRDQAHNLKAQTSDEVEHSIGNGEVCRVWRQGRPVTVTDKDGVKEFEVRDYLEMSWQKPINRINKIPVFLIDADLDAEIAGKFFPELKTVDIPAPRNAHVVQISDTARSLTSLLSFDSASDSERQRSANRLNDAREMIRREAWSSKRVLVIAPKKIRIVLTGQEPDVNNRLPVSGAFEGNNDVQVAHFGAIRGIDTFKDFDTVVVVSRNQPPAEGIEGVARALWWDRETPLQFHGDGRLPTEERLLERTRGRSETVSVDIHPDPDVQRLMDQIRERETLQGIDRLRLIHIEAPKRVVVLSNIPLEGLAADEVKTWNGLVPCKGVIAFMRYGVMPSSATAQTECFPDLWKTANAAKKDRRSVVGERGVQTLIDILLRTCTPLKVSYRKIGKTRGSPSTALIDGRHRNPQAELEKLVGPVQDFRILVGPADPVEVVSLKPPPVSEPVIKVWPTVDSPAMPSAPIISPAIPPPRLVALE